MINDDASRLKIINNLPPQVDLLLQLEALKNVERQNPLSAGSRRERVAEHSWHIALGVILLSEHSPDDLDIARAVLLACVHDVVEAFVGDTFAFGSDVDGQRSREEGAIAHIRATFPQPTAALLADLWEEYEAQATPEARFVKGIDAFLPILLNFLNPEESSWKNHGVDSRKVLKRLQRVEQPLGALAEINKEMVAQAVREGYLT
ncbi:HD domain-containing protein [Micromonospora sp. NPDC048835]|uniref:HD domain-containing protein n=1 Tax=Micromonospora sp. NPDC048835 TaxID=3155147 RepID=UPI00340E6E5E